VSCGFLADPEKLVMRYTVINWVYNVLIFFEPIVFIFFQCLPVVIVSCSGVILKSVHSTISAIDRYLRQHALSGTVGHSACRQGG